MNCKNNPTPPYFLGEPNAKGMSLGSRSFMKLYKNMFVDQTPSRTTIDDVAILRNEMRNNQEVSTW